MSTVSDNGSRFLNARAIKIQMLARIIGADIGDRPIVDHTGFTGYFDITNLTWAPPRDDGTPSQSDAPSLLTAVEEKLGIKLVPTKAPIEVLVIDQIDRPTPN